MTGAGEEDNGRLRVGPYLAEPATPAGDRPEPATPAGDRPEPSPPSGKPSEPAAPSGEASRPSAEESVGATPNAEGIAADPDGIADHGVTQALPVVSDDASVPRTVRAVARRVASALPSLGRTEDDGPRLPRSARATVDRRKRAAGRSGPTGQPAAAAEAGESAAGDVPAQPGVPPDPSPIAATAEIGDGPVGADAGEREADPEPAADEDAAIAAEHVGADDEVSDAATVGPTGSTGRPPQVLGGLALGDAQTDEWADLVADIADRDPAEEIGGHHDPPPNADPGPDLAGPEAWGPDTQRTGAYHGRRRAKAPALRTWLMIGLVLAGLAAAAGIPMLLRPSPAGEDAAGSPAIAGGVTAPGSTASPAASPSVSRTPGPTARPSRPAAVPPVTRKPAPATTAPFPAVTLQAEQAELAGSAEVDSNPCGLGGLTVVRGVGDWPAPRRAPDPGDGTITFTSLELAEPGEYVVTVHYIMSPGDPRDLVITVNGTTTTHQFPNSDCAVASRKLTLTLDAGAQTMVLGNPDARAPTIDKIVITRP